MPEIAYVNGTFCELSRAVVPIEDRGFQFADGVYEVVVAYGDTCFGLDEHLARLKRSLEGIRLAFDLDRHRIREVIAEGINRAGFPETMVYLQITRGVAPRAHNCLSELRPTVVATFKPKPRVAPEKRERGLSVITVPDVRWSFCYIKSVALLPNVLARNDALARGYDDAVFVAPGGEVREATASNVFAVREGTLLSPQQTEAILPGVTRSFILDCASRIELPHREGVLRQEDLESADELFLSSTTMDVLAVTRLNDRPVGDGRVGPVTRALYEQFRCGLAEVCG